MREELGFPGSTLNKFRGYWHKIAQLGSADELSLLEQALQNENQISFGGGVFVEPLLLYLELRKLDLNPHITFSAESLSLLIDRIQAVMLELGKAADQTTELVVSNTEESSVQLVIDADELDVLFLQLHLLILRFEAHFLRNNNTPPSARENSGLWIPPLSIHDVLEEAYFIQEELGKSILKLNHEANRELLKNSQHLATHHPEHDRSYFKQFGGTISNLWEWQLYQFDREFSEVLEWAYQRSSEEKFLELQEHFLSLLMLRRYPYSKPDRIQVLKQHKFSHAILNRTPKNLDRFQLFWGEFEKLRKKLGCYAIRYTIAYLGGSYDPEYLTLIRQFFRFHFQFQMWRQLHSNERISEFSPENEMRIMIMAHSTEAILGVYLWHSKIELMNLFRPNVYFIYAFRKILATLERDENFKFSGPGVLDLLLSTVLHKMVLQYKSILLLRKAGYFAPNSTDNPFSQAYVLPKDTQLEETFLAFIPRVKGRFQKEKDGEFFFDVTDIFCRFFAFKLGDKKNSVKELQDSHASKIARSKGDQSERSLILEIFCRFLDFQLIDKPGLQQANQLLSSYTKLWKFLEGKPPSLLMTLGVLEDYLNSFLEINRKRMEQGIAKTFLKNVDDSHKMLLQRCRDEFLSSESTVVQKKERPKELKTTEVSKKKPVSPKVSSKSTGPAVAKISLEEKWLSEHERAGTLIEKASALVELAKLSKALANTQKWVEEFFRVVLVENLRNEALSPQIEKMMAFLESQKWIPMSRKSPFLKSVLDFLGVFFKRTHFDNLKNEAERVDSILSLMSRLEILTFFPKDSHFMEEMKQWFEHFLESVVRTPGLNLNAKIQSILEKLKEFNIIPFSREITISHDFFRQEKDSSSVLDFFAEKKVPVYIFGGATRDFIVEQNRPKKERASNKITPEDLDIFVALGKNDLEACLRDRFGLACSVMGGDNSYYIKISFPGGSNVDVVSLGEETSEPLLLSLVRKTDSFDFNINCGIYSVQDNVYYSFRGAFENIKNLKFSFATPYNQQSSEPKHIFRAMALLAKYLPKSRTFSFSDEEVYLKQLEILKTRWPKKDTLSSDVTENERKLVNNAVLNSFCRGNASSTFLVSMKHQSFTVLFPSLIEFIGSEEGRKYLESCCKEADLTFSKKELKSAHFSYRIGYLLSLFFCLPILEQSEKAEIQEMVSLHVQSCLFWTHPATRTYVEVNIQNARKGSKLDIFSVANLWITDVVGPKSSIDSGYSTNFVNGANGLL